MNKAVVLVLSTVLVTAVTAFAYGHISFTDSDDFADWYKGSVEKIADLGVIKGYNDGSFGPNKNVTRAELAVMLDRYEEKMREMSEVKSMTLINSLARLGYLGEDFTGVDGTRRIVELAVILAEAGFARLDSAPGNGSDLFEKVENLVDIGITDYELPAGYTLYSDLYVYYLHYQGFRNFGQDGLEVDEWYGPFSVYSDSLGRNGEYRYYYY